MADETTTTAMAPPRGANADRRTPRFSWTPAYEETFFRSLCESMQMGFKDNHSFKPGAWERAAIALRDKHQAYPEKSHLINKADNARKKFRMWRGLREDPDFLYNPASRMVTASEEAWQRHFEKEPLSKALRGRPFEHEEYMEILFPDVVGSGGAPKRTMKKRKTLDGSGVPTAMTPEQAGAGSGPNVADLTTNSNTYSRTQSLNPTAQPAATSQLPTPMPGTSTTQRPLSTVIPPRPAVVAPPSHSALTPPDELASDPVQAPKPSPGGQSEPRRRGRPSRFSTGSGHPYTAPPRQTSASATPTANQSWQAPTASPVRTRSALHTYADHSPHLEEVIYALADALKTREPPRWPEQALEIFFRDFADEDADLQLKIAEKALTDENKAMVFVKSPPELRRHWVARLRDMHMRNFGIGGGVGLGRVGEVAS